MGQHLWEEVLNRANTSRASVFGPTGQHRSNVGPPALDLMSGLLDCIMIYYRLAQSDSSLGLRLMSHRKILRCPTRPQAIGRCALTQSP